MIKLLPGCVLFLIAFHTWAESSLSAWFSRDNNQKVRVQVDLFMTSTCPHCKKANAFLKQQMQKKPWLQISRYLINKDISALDYFHKRLQQQKIDDYSVPAIFFCNSHWIGFDKTMESTLENSLEYCYTQIKQTGALTPLTQSILQQRANAIWYRTGIDTESSAKKITVWLAILDAISFCSSFYFVTFFAFVWLLPHRKLQVIAFLLFILTIGTVHYFSVMNPAWMTQANTGLRVPAFFMGILLTIYTVIASLKRIYSPLVLLTFIVPCIFLQQIYQQGCIPNFSLVFQQWFTGQINQSFWHSMYPVFYIGCYLLVFVLFFLLLYFFHKCTKGQNLFTHIAWCIVFTLGCFYIFYPIGLANPLFSFSALSLLTLLGWLVTKTFLFRRMNDG